MDELIESAKRIWYQIISLPTFSIEGILSMPLFITGGILIAYNGKYTGTPTDHLAVGLLFFEMGLPITVVFSRGELAVRGGTITGIPAIIFGSILLACIWGMALFAFWKAITGLHPI